MAKIQGSPRFRAVDPATGAALAGGKLFSYIAGTVTPKATFTDQTGAVANPNPTILDGNGEANVWLGAGSYKFVLADAYDVVLWTVDGIQIPDSETLSALTVTGASTLAAVTVSGQIISTVATGTAPMVISSTTKVTNLNADLLKGKTWAAPDPIGATTPSTGKFSTLETDGVATFNVNVIKKSDDLQQTPNAAQCIRGQLSEEITLNTGGTTTDSAANLLPANAIIEAVVARVTQGITTATDWKLGDASQAARFLGAQSGGQLALGATAVGLAHRDPTVASADLGLVQSAAAKLRITTTGTPGAGKIRITVFWTQFIAPTS